MAPKPKGPQPSPDKVQEGPPARGPACPTTGGEHVREDDDTVRSLSDGRVTRRGKTGHWAPDAPTE